jgi:hypothetical protein
MDMGRRVNSIEKGPGMHGTVTVKVELSWTCMSDTARKNKNKQAIRKFFSV